MIYIHIVYITHHQYAHTYIYTYIYTCIYTYIHTNTVLEITTGHWQFSNHGHVWINFNIWQTKIYFSWPNILNIFNGKAINNLQNVHSSKNSWPISDFYFYHCIYAYIHTYICTYMHTNIHTYTHTCVRTHVCTYICTRTSIFTLWLIILKSSHRNNKHCDI